MAKTNEGNIFMTHSTLLRQAQDRSGQEVKVCVLRSDGTNCDNELYYAFKKFGGSPEFVHVNELRNKSKSLKDFHILALPGGFSYGDDIASGKILAIELISFLKDEIERFVKKGNLVIGICNGFQTLVRTGLLPFGNLGKMDVTLAANDSGHFECRWIKLKLETHSTSLRGREPSGLRLRGRSDLRFRDHSDSRNSRSRIGSGQESKCVFLKEKYSIGHFSVNHGEGKFFASPEVIEEIENKNLVVFRYVDKNGNPTQIYPDNPNGSLNAIAGITDPTGRILGLMPHPEKFIDATQYPNWRREKIVKAHGAFMFEEMINYVKEEKGLNDLSSK